MPLFTDEQIQTEYERWLSETYPEGTVTNGLGGWLYCDLLEAFNAGVNVGLGFSNQAILELEAEAREGDEYWEE